MKRVVQGAFVVAAACAVIALGCMDRKPTPVCPVPTEVTTAESMVAGFDGVDLLVVVDNSKSMLEEQAILATGFFTLVNSLVKPISGPPVNWSFPAVANMRVAVTSSDMGLQWGENGSTDGAPSITNCGGTGDDGEFQTILTSVTGVNIESGQIACEKNGTQCPEGFTCTAGLCEATQSPFWINCPQSPAGGNAYAETSAEDGVNTDLATEVSCMSALGTDGCGIEQQLQAAARALERNGQGMETDDQAGFLKTSHLLAVLVVSDEEDCSIEDPGVFTTPEWTSGSLYQNNDPATGHLNTACNYPESNDTNFLWDPEVYYDQFIALKGGNPGAVIFAAIAGVPQNDTCEGRGDEIGGCLSSDEMQLQEELFEHPDVAGEYFYGFTPACQRTDPDTGEDVTTARPGRRYVTLAEKFSGNSFMYSICNEDWGPAMESIAEVIAEAIGAQCYPKPLEWVREPVEGCAECGAAACDMLAIVSALPGETEYPSCPEGLVEVPDSQEVVNEIYRTYCEVPKIAAPLYCDQADDYIADEVGQNQPGWYYCENLNQENFEEACEDNVDNDGDGAVDCNDTNEMGCSECEACGGPGGGTCLDKCTYSVEMTNEATDLTRGYSITIQCLQQFNFEDENCQENSELACNNGKDDDGNGVWDCTDGEDHFADPNCCPLEMGDGETCHPVSNYGDICDAPITDNDADSRTVCEAAAFAAGCTLTAN